MRKLFGTLMAVAMLGIAGYGTPASADSMAFVFTGSSTGTETVAPGDTVTYNIVFNITTSGLIFATTDLSLSNTNALMSSVTNNPGVFQGGLANWALRTSNTFQVATGSCPTGNITVNTCTGSAQYAGIYGGVTAGSLQTGTFTVGSVTLTAMAPGSSTLSFTARPKVSTWVDSAGNDLTTPPSENSVTVTVIPEPATASLIGLGLVGLVLAGRRSRS